MCGGRTELEAPAKLPHRWKDFASKKCKPAVTQHLSLARPGRDLAKGGGRNGAQFRSASMTQLSHLQNGKDPTASSQSLREIPCIIYNKSLLNIALCHHYKLPESQPEPLLEEGTN